MITAETRIVYRATEGRRGRLTLRSACRDAAWAIVRHIAGETGDNLNDLMHDKRAQVDRVAKAMERRFRRAEAARKVMEQA